MPFVIFTVIGLIAGLLAGRLLGGHGHGVMGDSVIGITGGFLGGWLFAALLGVAGTSFLMSLISAFVGAVVLVGASRLMVPACA